MTSNLTKIKEKIIFELEMVISKLGNDLSISDYIRLQERKEVYEEILTEIIEMIKK